MPPWNMHRRDRPQALLSNGGDVCHPGASIIESSIGRLQECRQDADRQALPRKPPLLQFVWRGHRRASLSFDALQLQLKVRAINPHHLTSFRKTSIDDQRPDVITGLRFCAAAVTPQPHRLPVCSPLCSLCLCGLLQRYRSSALSSPVRSTPADSIPLTTVEPITIANETKA
jgi:hypothetical protein